MYFDVIIAGFGGQGVLFIGNLLAYATMAEGHKCTYMPVYGVEMRGGTANCTVVVSDDEIGSPIIQHPVSCIAMNKPSLIKFGSRVKKDGALLVNASLIDPKDVKIKGPEIIMVPAMELARDAGNDRLANLVLLGALAAQSGVTSVESLTKAMEETLPERSHKMIPGNAKALARGARFIETGE